MKKTLLAFTTLAALTFASCDKDNNEEGEDTTLTAANLSGTYKITAVTANGINVFDNSTATFNVFQPCQRDDLYKLNANLSYEVVDAGTVCTPTNATTGTWSLTGTTVTIAGEASTVESFNGRTVVLTKVVQGATVKSTFVKQ